jgi:hypothetical protein
VLPTEEVRVASMVPADATDIRDSTGESFSIVDSLNLRAGVLEIVAITCVALGALMLIFVLVRVARRGRQRTPGRRTPALDTKHGRRLDSRADRGAARTRTERVDDGLAARAPGGVAHRRGHRPRRPVSQRLAGSPLE